MTIGEVKGCGVRVRASLIAFFSFLSSVQFFVRIFICINICCLNVVAAVGNFAI
jgi:hypothetical protein